VIFFRDRDMPPMATMLIAREVPPYGGDTLFANMYLALRDAVRRHEARAGRTDRQHQTRVEFTCRFNWRVGSMAFWDNRCVLHNPVNDYHGFKRVMHRVTLAGDRPR
jgi:taurine dioxygenase